MCNRKWSFIFLFFYMCMFIVGCGGKTTAEREVEEIYEKVLENYHEAKTLIYGTSIELGEEITDEKGQIYFVVEEPAYQDLESIQKVLKSTFSTAYIETYLSWVLEGEYPFYKEINGRLCVAMADAVGQAPTKEIVSILDKREDLIKIIAAGYENESYEITLIQEENEWVIDQIDWSNEE